MTRLRLFAFPIALVPVVAGFLYVATYGVNVPVQDDWGTVITLSRDAAGTLSLPDLFAAHNEQRIFFPRLAEIALAKIGGYSPLAEMYVTQASLLAMLVVLALVMWRTLGRDAVLLVPVIAYLVFSVRQTENMLLGFDLSNVFAAAFGVIALALLWFSVSSSGRRRIVVFAGALATATIAAFSSSQGLAVSHPPAPPPPPPSPAELQADPSPSSCTLDSINGAPAGDRPSVSLDRGYLVFAGWCLAPGNRLLAGGVNVVLDGRYVPAYYGQYRPDVADFFHRRKLVYAGFEAAVRLPAGAKGVHSVAVVALSRDRKRSYQPTSTFTFRTT